MKAPGTPANQPPASAGENLVQIECTDAELGALGKISKSFVRRQDWTASELAAYVLTTALLHWEKIEPFIFARQDYAKAEGLKEPGLMQAFNEKTIALKFKLRAKREVAS